MCVCVCVCVFAPFVTHCVCRFANTDYVVFAGCRLRCCVCGAINTICVVFAAFLNAVFAFLQTLCLQLSEHPHCVYEALLADLLDKVVVLTRSLNTVFTVVFTAFPLNTVFGCLN